MSGKADIFRERINNIITDLLRDGTYEDFINLQTNKTCNAHAIFLEQELDQGFKKVELAQFATTVLLAQGKTVACSTEKCDNVKEELDRPRYSIDGKLKSKKQLCRGIAIYYVRVFNLLAALMVGLDPDNNMCNKRIKALYKKAKDVENQMVVTVCNPDSDLYPSDIMKIKGLTELMALYQQYNIEGMDEYNAQVEEEVNELMKRFSEAFGDTVMANNNNNNDNEEQEEVPVPEEAQETLNALNKTISKNNRGKAGNKQPKNNNKSQGNTTQELVTTQPTALPNGPKTGNNKPNAGNNRPNAGNNRPNAGNNRPNAGNNGTKAGNNGTKAANNRANQGLVTTEPTEMPQQNTTAMPQQNTTAPPPPPSGLQVEGSNSNSNNMKGGSKKLRGGSRKTKKVMKGGAGFFQTIGDFFGGESEKPLTAMEAPPEISVQSTDTAIAKQEVKTLKEFREFMERTRNAAPADMFKRTLQKPRGKLKEYPKNAECKNEVGTNRKVSMTSPSFAEYLKNMEEMKNHYNTSRQSIDALLSKLVDTSKTRGVLKQISSDDLLKLEQQTRKVLVNHYTRCQELFRDGFKLLVTGIRKEKKAEEDANIEKARGEIDA